MHDIQMLYKHLKKRIEAYMVLEKYFSYENWIPFAKVTLSSVHVFNRQRTEEIERMQIEDFKNCEK